MVLHAGTGCNSTQTTTHVQLHYRAGLPKQVDETMPVLLSGPQEALCVSGRCASVNAVAHSTNH